MAGGKSDRGGRRISGDEADLWSQVIRSVEPLGNRPAGTEPAPTPEIRPAAGASDDGAARVAAGATARSESVGQQEFDRRKARQIAAGRVPIEALLDLHGMRQNEAHGALRAFLQRAQAGGLRFVTVVTGKGSPRPRNDDAMIYCDREERGVLRRMVPMWLGEADFRALVVAWTPAGRGHGGEGALYVQVRRAERVKKGA